VDMLKILRRLRGSPPASSRRVEVSIGIRRGSSPLVVDDHGTQSNPVLTASDINDVRAQIVADPFMVRHDEKWFMFFEVFDQDQGRGLIGLATSGDGFAWAYDRIVLSEPFHLSYPYVFEHEHHFYMIPESGAVSEVRLYEASSFPGRWVHKKTLIGGHRFVDASVVQFAGSWWLFAETSGGRHDTLRLYQAPDLLGPWSEHPSSPVVEGDAGIARPAGRLIESGGRLFRFAQDCSEKYGTRVVAFEITRISDTEFEERLVERPVLRNSGRGWNSRGMHHIDLHRVGGHGWLACVDGFNEVE
jgi:hypothetical protein